MQSIIETLFIELMEDGTRFQRQIATDSEYAAYKAIRDALNDNQKKAFDKFEELYSNRHCEGIKEIYFYGFRMGARLAFEIMDADFTLSFP